MGDHLFDYYVGIVEGYLRAKEADNKIMSAFKHICGGYQSIAGDLIGKLNNSTSNIAITSHTKQELSSLPLNKSEPDLSEEEAEYRRIERKYSKKKEDDSPLPVSPPMPADPAKSFFVVPKPEKKKEDGAGSIRLVNVAGNPETSLSIEERADMQRKQHQESLSRNQIKWTVPMKEMLIDKAKSGMMPKAIALCLQEAFRVSMTAVKVSSMIQNLKTKGEF